MLASIMSEAEKNATRFMRFQHMLEQLQRQTNELHRLALAADRRIRAPEAPLKRTARKKH